MSKVEVIEGLMVEIVRLVVDYPNQVRLTSIMSGSDVEFKLSVSGVDLGKVIGKQGRMARALRSLLSAFSLASKVKISLHIEEN